MNAKRSRNYTDLEIVRTRNVARELKEGGFKVVREPSWDELPYFLREYSYLPDLIATSGDENLVVEVKSQPSVRGDFQISEIADRVNKEPNWRFLFVYSNPRSKVEIRPEISEYEFGELMARLGDAKRQVGNLTSPMDYGAYLLYFWGLLEASLRQAIPSASEVGSSISSYSLVRDARIEGLISEEQFYLLKQLQKIRNLISHGYYSTPVDIVDLKELVSISESLITESRI